MKVKTLTLLSGLAMSLAIVGCSKTDDNQTAGQKLDSAIASTEQKTDEMQAKADAKMDQAGEKIDQMQANAKSEWNDAKQNMDAKTDAAAAKMSDASITSSVNAQLAKDNDLSAMRIDVDTKGGHVTLHGTAPTEAAKEKATQLASAIEGVNGVNNELSIKTN